MKRKIKTSFCFFDETGLLGGARDPFFAVGMIKTPNPVILYSQIKRERYRQQFYDEVKWTRVYRKNASIMKKLIDIFFDTRGVRFSCQVFKKNELDLQKHFGGNLWRAYESFAVMEIKGNIDKDEIVAVLADDVDVPPDVKFETNVERRINNEFRRLAVHGVCRVHSKGVELVQLTDLLLGAVVYDFKLEAKLIKHPSNAKRAVLRHLKKKLGVKSLSRDFRTRRFNIWIFKPK